MKTTAALLAAVMLLGASPAHADDGALRGRGWLTGVGLGLAVVSLTGFGLGIGGALQLGDANAQLRVYVPADGVPAPGDVETVKLLQTRADGGRGLAVAGFVIGGLGLAGSLACLILDGVWAKRPVDVAFAPSAGGGTFVVSARF